MKHDHRISVSRQRDFPEASFIVEITDIDGSQSSHIVMLSRQYYQQLAGANITPEELVRYSFIFLLEREPKEAILPTFTLPIISKYFPEYEITLRQMLEVN